MSYRLDGSSTTEHALCANSVCGEHPDNGLLQCASDDAGPLKQHIDDGWLPKESDGGISGMGRTTVWVAS